jgi:hypothetical protein
LVDEALRPIVPALQKPKVRMIMEREPPDQASEKIVARLKKEAKLRLCKLRLQRLKDQIRKGQRPLQQKQWK